MPSGNNVHWSESELADAERPAQSPGTRNRSQSELVLQAVQKAIERHPSFARKLGLQIVPNEDAESTGGPQKQSSETQVTGQPKFLSREYWGSRAFWRHTFYVVISIALLVVVAQLLKLQRSTKEQRFVVERALRKQGGLGPVVKSALTTQGALIAVNLFIAYRGVQIWQLIQRVKVVDVLQRVGGAGGPEGPANPRASGPANPRARPSLSVTLAACPCVPALAALRPRSPVPWTLPGWVDPFTRHSGRVIKLVTMPVRSAVRGLTAPGRAAAERRAQQAALEALVQSRASGWRPLSAPITTAWRHAGPVGRSRPTPRAIATLGRPECTRAATPPHTSPVPHTRPEWARRPRASLARACTRRRSLRERAYSGRASRGVGRSAGCSGSPGPRRCWSRLAPRRGNRGSRPHEFCTRAHARRAHVGTLVVSQNVPCPRPGRSDYTIRTQSKWPLDTAHTT